MYGWFHNEKRKLYDIASKSKRKIFYCCLTKWITSKILIRLKDSAASKTDKRLGYPVVNLAKNIAIRSPMIYQASVKTLAICSSLLACCFQQNNLFGRFL